MTKLASPARRKAKNVSFFFRSQTKNQFHLQPSRMRRARSSPLLRITVEKGKRRRVNMGDSGRSWIIKSKITVDYSR